MPSYAGFCGPSNPSQSLQADCERTMNLYVEKIESGAAPTGAALYPTPGLEEFVTTADLEPRAEFYENGRAFAVIGTGFYEVFEDGSKTLRGTVAEDDNLAQIFSNGTSGGQLFIVSGTNGYCFVLATNTLSTVLTGEAVMGGMLNARFLAFNPVNGKVRMSALNDGTTWDPTLFFQRSAKPDPWKAMIVFGSEIALVGERTGEFWYDSGAFPQPFALIPGSVFQYGIGAPFSLAAAGDWLTWISDAKCIVAARGYTPQRISNYAVDHAIAGFARDNAIADAEALVYEDEGHLFGCFNFPTANATWVTDFGLGNVFHERGTWNAVQGRWDVWGPRVYMNAWGKHLVGSRGSGAISRMDITIGSELDATAIRRMRIGPPIWASSRQRLNVDRFELKVEPGLGLTSGQGANPQVMLATSTNAKTWGSERVATAGAQGHYDQRVFWTRCGSSDTMWVPKIVLSDPIPWKLSGAEIDGSGFAQAQSAA